MNHASLFTGIGGLTYQSLWMYTNYMANMYTKVEPDIKKMIHLYNLGMSQQEVAEEMGLTQKIVWRCLRDANVKCRKAAPRNQKGISNNNWKGDNVGYAAFHKRVESAKGKPKKCEKCGTTDDNKHYDWANMTGKYNDPNDYKRLCRSCHWKLDGIINNIKNASR